MKNKRLSVARLAGAIVLALVFGLIVMAAFGTLLAGGIGAAVSITLSLMPGNANKMGITMMALQTEVWTDKIEGTLFKDSMFLTKSVDDSEHVNNKTVHIPNAGAPPGVQKNRVINGAPTNPQTREDSEVTYDIGEFTVDPIIITDAEVKELSYAKMDSELSEMQTALNERVAEDILISWAPTGTATLVDGVTTNDNILRTSGIKRNDLTADRVTYPAHVEGATGARLGLGLYDIKLAQKIANKQNWPKAGRFALLDADMYDQLVLDMTNTQYTDFSKTMNPETGELGQIYGFTFYNRSTVLRYTNATPPVVKAYGAAGAATDNGAALFWYQGFVSRAVGETRVFDQEDSPTHYGDVFSCLVRAGGGKRRKTEVGVLAIVQAHPEVGV